MTMEQYLQVAQMYYAEQEEGFNPFDGSEEEYAKLAVQINAGFQVTDDGWIDSGEKVNTLQEEEDQERDGVKFDPNLARSAEYRTYKKRRSKSPVKKTTEFVLPSQVNSLNNKIRHLFHRQADQYDVEDDTI